MKPSGAGRRLWIRVIFGFVLLAIAISDLLVTFLGDGESNGKVETSPVMTFPTLNQSASDLPTAAPFRPTNAPFALEEVTSAFPTAAPTIVVGSSKLSSDSPSVLPSANALIPDVVEQVLASAAPSLVPSSIGSRSRSTLTSSPTIVTNNPTFSIPPTSDEGSLMPSAMPSETASNVDGSSPASSGSTDAPSPMPSTEERSLSRSYLPSSMPSFSTDFISPPPSSTARSPTASDAPSSLPKAPPSPLTMPPTSSHPKSTPSKPPSKVGEETSEPTLQAGEPTSEPTLQAGEQTSEPSYEDEDEEIGSDVPSTSPSSTPVGACEDKRGLVMFLEMISGEMQDCAWLAEQENNVHDLYCSSFDSILSGCALTCGNCASEGDLNNASCKDDDTVTFSAVRPIERTCQWLARRTNKIRLKMLCDGSVDARESCAKTCDICQE